MSRTIRILLGVVLVGVVVAAASLGYIWLSGGSGEASKAVAAPTLAPHVAAGGEDVRVFEIVPGESEVRFILNEVLWGQPNTVVGRTNQVAGQVAVNLDAPAESRLGPIRVNVRTMATDSAMRDRTIRGRILQSAEDAFEFAEFVPTALEGMPDTATIGEPVTFTIVGNLRIRDVTRPVSFSATVTPVTETRLEGLATATVLREDFGLAIPNVPGVADVSSEVRLEIDFVALSAA